LKGLEVGTLAQTIAYLEEFRTALNTRQLLLAWASQTAGPVYLRVMRDHVCLSGRPRSSLSHPLGVRQDFDEAVEDFSREFFLATGANRPLTASQKPHTVIQKSP